MSTSLNALLTQLKWQKNELDQYIRDIEVEQVTLESELSVVVQKINQSYSKSAHINPELEVNKLQFVMQQQQYKDELQAQLKTQDTQKKSLDTQLQRIKTELKMLEKYLLKHQQQQQYKQQKAEEQHLEEWVLQQSEFA